MRISISGESTMDLQKESLKEYEISSIPFHVQKGDENILDGKYSNEELFDYTEKTGQLCRTSACNVSELEEHFSSLLKYSDKVIHFTISSDLSSGYQNAVIAKNDNANIEVIDSRSISLGIALMAIYARKLINDGKDNFASIVDKVKAFREHVHASLLIDKLNYMNKGGRCSKLMVLGANLLQIKPAIVAKEGKLTVGAKYRGKLDKAVLDYIDGEIGAHQDIDYSIVGIGYTSTPKDVIDKAVKRLYEKGFKKVLLEKTNATDACHGGPNVIGLAFASGR